VTDSGTITPILSKLLGVDKELFENRKSSKELEAMRKQWDAEFEERLTSTQKVR